MQSTFCSRRGATRIKYFNSHMTCIWKCHNRHWYTVTHALPKANPLHLILNTIIIIIFLIPVSQTAFDCVNHCIYIHILCVFRFLLWLYIDFVLCRLLCKRTIHFYVNPSSQVKVVETIDFTRESSIFFVGF